MGDGLVNSPSLPYVDYIYPVWASLPQVRLHVDLQVLGTDVALC